MILKEIGSYTISYIRNGNNKNGNPVYLINVFINVGDETVKEYCNVNYTSIHKRDKNGNIRLVSYNIDNSIRDILSYMD